MKYLLFYYLIFVNILATDYKYHIVSYFIKTYKYYFFVKILLINKFLRCFYFEIIYCICK